MGFNLLTQFGHCLLLPFRYSRVGGYVANQRHDNKLYSEGKQSHITPQRMRELESVEGLDPAVGLNSAFSLHPAFVWTVTFGPTVTIDPTACRRALITSRQCTESFLSSIYMYTSTEAAGRYVT